MTGHAAEPTRLSRLRPGSMDLRGRLLWLAMLPVVVFAIVWGVYVIRQRAADLEAQLQQRAQLLARQLAVAADYGIFSFNQTALNNLAQGVARESSVIAATIFDADGKVLASHRIAEPRAPAFANKLQTILDASVRSGGGAVSDKRGEWVVHLEPVRSPLLNVDDLPEQTPGQLSRSLQGYAVVEVSTQSISAELFNFGLRVMALLAGVLASGWFMARRFSKRIDQRIQAVVQAAQRIGAGQSDIRLSPSRIPSFDRLSNDINSMASQLEQSRLRLEQRVQEATQALREQRDAAQKANQDKTRFLAAASHDLRQPMHALNLLVEAIKLESREHERARLLERIEVTSQAMSSLLDALLDISRLDAGGVRPHAVPFDLQSVLGRLRDIYEGQAERRGIELVIQGSRLGVRSDPMLLERILGNFLSNALRYTPPGGRVLMAVRSRGKSCLVQVRDNGPGIARESQADIFHEFVQLHNPQRDRSQGLGLGLAIVERLARLLQHPIGLRSCAGHGSTFQIQLPKCDLQHELLLPAATAETAGPDAQPTAGLDGCRILLVEDDVLVRESYLRLLQFWDCDTRVHAGAVAALDALDGDAWRPHLVITDHRLGERLNGRQLIEELRRRFTMPLPAIIMTGDTEDTNLRHAQDEQILVLYKPVKPVDLRQALLKLWRTIHMP